MGETSEDAGEEWAKLDAHFAGIRGIGNGDRARGRTGRRVCGQACGEDPIGRVQHGGEQNQKEKNPIPLGQGDLTDVEVRRKGTAVERTSQQKNRIGGQSWQSSQKKTRPAEHPPDTQDNG